MTEELYHVLPNGDLIEHITSMKCECDPVRLPAELVVIHNALDNREFDEIAAGINE